ncbi:hypothetical protein [Mucilaginibacter myungsuensis]|uniref:Outer membrane protein with beta-barrel domain n=1 Tax=Mucilaginibacter myungsuensis TaxID=649104 RepID=A0A929KY61_9SPHI|nr:hypothetical protein [Mucilaginibacter myungsuensis]MBE9663327.1 hypothetical protein [Mucilaginibacter myungsuensis]MDN3600062.1 hypothetical protein [Mucilaginibacter myungsuensis]
MKSIYFFLAALLLTVTSCNNRFYAPALYQNDVSYLPKPSTFDSSKSATYISIGGGFNQTVNSSNSVSFGELNISEGHNFGTANLSYGMFGSLGAIDNSNHDNEKSDPNSFASKNFGALGGRAAFNFNKAMDNVNFRFFGVEAAYSREFGDFAAYRRQVALLPNYNAITRTEMLTLGATSEILWHSPNNKNTQHALRGFIGKTFGDFSQVRSNLSEYTPNIPLYLTVSYYAKFDQFWGAAELTKNDVSIPGFRIKMGYRF